MVAGLMVVVVVIVAALAVDIGMQRVARTDMQSLADVVALDLSRELGERTVSSFQQASPTIDRLAAESRDRNQDTLGSTPTLDVDLGEVGVDGEFMESTDPGFVPTAVRVTARTDVAFAFGVMDSGSAQREAVGQQTEDAGCFEIGSFTAALDLGDSALAPLADLLGLETTLDLVSYRNLAAASVSLFDVAAAPSIGTTEALLAPSGVRVGDLVSATAYALQYGEGGSSSAVAASVLRGLLAPSAGLDLDTLVEVADVVSVDAGNTAALASKVNVLELIGASLSLANKSSLLDTRVPVDLSAVGLGTASLSLTAVQGPRYACGTTWPDPSDECEVVTAGGGACARQSQVRLELRVDQKTLPLFSSTDPLVSGGINAVVGPISLTGGVGNAKGVLTSVDSCGPPDQITVNVRSGLLGVQLQVPVRVSGSVSLNLQNVLPGPLQNLVGNVLNLPGLLTGILGGTQYEYRNYRVTVDVSEVGVDLGATSPGTTGNDDARLVSPTNDRTGSPVKVPSSPQALKLGSVGLPSTFLSGRVTVRLAYEWRSRQVTLLGLPVLGWRWGPTNPGTGPSNGWTSNAVQAPPGTNGGVLLTGNLADLASLPAPLGGVGATVTTALNGVTNAVNTQVVGAVNGVLDGVLLRLLGISGAGADLYSVSRPLCGGPPRLVD